MFFRPHNISSSFERGAGVPARPSSHMGFRRSLSEKDVELLEPQLSTFYTSSFDDDDVGGEDDEDEQSPTTARDPAVGVGGGGVANVIKAVTQSATANWFKDPGPLDLVVPSEPSPLDEENRSDCSENNVKEKYKEHRRSTSSGSAFDLLKAKGRSPSMRDLHRSKNTNSLVVPDGRESRKSNSLTRVSSPWEGSFGSNNKKPEIVYENYLNLAKLRENDRKKMRKHWVVSWAVLTPNHLSFFKDENYKQSRPIKPDLLVELLFCQIEWTKALSSREHVFLLKSPSIQLLGQSHSQVEAQNWFSKIEDTIRNNQKNFNTLFPETRRYDEETIQRRYKEPASSSSIPRDSRSMTMTIRRSKNKLAITPVEPKEQGGNIQGTLRKFLKSRPAKQDLVEKGIYHNEAVFGCTVQELAKREGRSVPIFMEKCIGVIESSEENLKTDGIYRASGNLSLIQKIRLEVDQHNLKVLEDEDDIHVLTGALKLFLREMPEPLIPTDKFDKFLDACPELQGDAKLEEYRSVTAELPEPNYASLKFLLRHLLNVSQYSEFNRMQISNLSIVFGPTIMWSPSESHASMAVDLMKQNCAVEFLLSNFQAIFGD